MRFAGGLCVEMPACLFSCIGNCPIESCHGNLDCWLGMGPFHTRPMIANFHLSCDFRLKPIANVVQVAGRDKSRSVVESEHFIQVALSID